MIILTDDGKIIEGTEITVEESEIYNEIVQDAHTSINVYFPNSQRRKLANWLIGEYKITHRTKKEDDTIEEEFTETSPADEVLTADVSFEFK